MGGRVLGKADPSGRPGDGAKGWAGAPEWAPQAQGSLKEGGGDGLGPGQAPNSLQGRGLGPRAKTGTGPCRRAVSALLTAGPGT